MISEKIENNQNSTEQEALKIIYDTSKGLDHMHSLETPIAHRDIKIENILKKGKNYKLCDFGSSSDLTIDPKKCDKNYLGEQFSSFDKFTTFMYRPPEMCDQYCKYLINEKVDVWMLGCVLFTILFKKQPFQDAQKLAIINAHYYIPEDGEGGAHYSEKILDFMRLLLTPNPAFRPSIKQVLSLITNWNTMKSVPLNVRNFF